MTSSFQNYFTKDLPVYIREALLIGNSRLIFKCRRRRFAIFILEHKKFYLSSNVQWQLSFIFNQWQLIRSHGYPTWPEVIPGLPLLPWNPVENKVVPLVLLKVVPGLGHSEIWPFFKTYIFSCTFYHLIILRNLHLLLHIIQLGVQALALRGQQIDIPKCKMTLDDDKTSP